MSKLFLIKVLLSFLLFFALIHAPSSKAETSLDDTKKLLQKGLTIYEIDQEVKRLSDKEVIVAAQIGETVVKISKQELLVIETRKRAGEVIRSYYTGERTSIWMALLTTNSLTQAIDFYEYLQRIFEHDHNTLEAYTTTYKELNTYKNELLGIQQQLHDVKQDFLNQRQRLVSLQKEVDEQLKQLPDAEAVVKQMEALNEGWRTRGLPLFNRYLKALGKVLIQLPEILADHNDVLTVKGLTDYTLTINEKLFNDFLISKNKEMFQNFSFHFGDEELMIIGRMDDVDLTIKAHFIVIDKPNSILVSIDELTFNNFVLPDTTRKSLQEQYDLSLYPNMLFTFLSATGVEMKDGVLKIKLIAEL